MLYKLSVTLLLQFTFLTFPQFPSEVLFEQS